MTEKDSTSSAAAVRHLAAIAPALRQGQAFSITRLTSIKALCRDPRDAVLFALHLATAAHREMERGRRPGHIDPDAWKRHQALASEGSTGFVRALDIGGLIWEGKDTYPSLDAAMAALDEKLARWMAKHL